mgnify:FL=1
MPLRLGVASGPQALTAKGGDRRRNSHGQLLQGVHRILHTIICRLVNTEIESFLFNLTFSCYFY